MDSAKQIISPIFVDKINQEEDIKQIYAFYREHKDKITYQEFLQILLELK